MRGPDISSDEVENKVKLLCLDWMIVKRIITKDWAGKDKSKKTNTIQSGDYPI